MDILDQIRADFGESKQDQMERDIENRMIVVHESKLWKKQKKQTTA